MAELTPKERLQPSLLDRLTDNEPDRQTESRDLRVMSPQRLRESVKRDLTWLFNAVNLTPVHDLEGLPEAERSTLNFGLPDLSGKTAVGIHASTLEKQIRKAIWEFEPRLIKSSVRVKLMQDRKEFGPNALCVVIEADLWSQPLPLRLMLRTDLNLETGEAQVSDVTGQVG
jgi:type VI secretion system protein ImpF